MNRSLKYRVNKYRTLIPFVLIGVAYYAVFNYIPLIWGVIISLKDFKVGSTLMDAKWVGLQNYIDVIQNPEMKKLLINTLRISVARLIFTFIPPIILTLVIFDLKNVLFKRISQTIVYVPHFFSWVIIYGIVYAFFCGTGFVNASLGMLGLPSYDFLTSKDAFVPLLVGSQVWKEAGWNTILYFAALTGVNPELFEAATLDGAGPIAKIRAICIPTMLSIITFSMIMALGNILNNDFEQILLYYNASVYEVADIIDTWVYRVGLGRMQYSIGAAVSMMKGFISMLLILGSNSLSKKLTGRGMF